MQDERPRADDVEAELERVSIELRRQAQRARRSLGRQFLEVLEGRSFAPGAAPTGGQDKPKTN